MTNVKYDVAGIGNAIVDVLSNADDVFLSDNGIEKGGMTLIDAERADALYAKMGSGIEVSGGSCANTIAGLASLGGSCAFFGKVRNDQLGEVFAHDIRALGVRYNTEALKAGPPTARCLILVTPDAQRSMNTFLGAAQDLGVEDIDDNVITDSAITYMEGYLWDPPRAKEAFLHASKIAHKAGRKVALTLSDAFCVARYRDEFRNLIQNEIDILFANEDEICSLYETTSFDEAIKQAQVECRLAAITRSEKGSVVIANGELHAVPAEKVDAVIDTTGAGDLYAAGFLFGLARGRGPVDCGRLGALAASEVIGHFGARPEVSLAELAAKKGL